MEGERQGEMSPGSLVDGDSGMNLSRDTDSSTAVKHKPLPQCLVSQLDQKWRGNLFKCVNLNALKLENQRTQGFKEKCDLT